MKTYKQVLLIFIFLISLFLTSCGEINVLVLPKEKGKNYLIGKAHYSDWTGRGGTLKLSDKFNSSITCTGERTLIKPSTTCAGKEYYAKLVCSNCRIAEVYFTKLSCLDAYGLAKDDQGNKYEVFLGISEELMKNKIIEYEGNSFSSTINQLKF
ncbi:MAG TPA: hypothetical protein VJ000_03805 [Thermodesulfovibrionia bacterium]|nr:hypothetical protein [Thermodesulfovibrionia bacterium]